MQTPPPVDSPREAGSSELDLSLDSFGSRPHRLGSEGPEGGVDSIEAFSPPSAIPRPPPTRQSTSSSAASITSLPHVDAPHHTVTSRFSQDSTTEDDSEKSKPSRERTNSIISLKGVRNLLRRSGGGILPTNTVVVKQNGLPLMSPGLNGHTTPQTRFNEEVPPVPSMGFFHHGSGMMPTLPPSSSQAPTKEKHRRADSGLDPFHFDQDSRYPVRSSGYISGLVPLASSPAVAFLPPPTPTTPTSSSMKTKGILKAWASRPKRADSAASHSIGSLFGSSPIEPSASSQGKDGTSKKRPGNLDTSAIVHNPGRTEFTPTPTPHTATPRELVGLGIVAEDQSPPTPLFQSPVFSEPRESMDTTARLSDFEIVSPAPPGRPRRGTENRI